MTQKYKMTGALKLTLGGLKKHIDELDILGEDLRELGYDTEKCLHNRDSKEYIQGVRILECVRTIKTELQLFEHLEDVDMAKFNKLSNKISRELNTLTKDLHTKPDLQSTVAIIAANILIALATGIGVLILAGKAIYALTTEEGLTLRSGFFGMRPAHEKIACDLKTELKELKEELFPTDSPKLKMSIN